MQALQQAAIEHDILPFFQVIRPLNMDCIRFRFKGQGYIGFDHCSSKTFDKCGLKR